ncbi:MAG: Ig-like domain-containing protein, partial [Clostridia bacterium]|nr:Ig-like domain-containing protein [Clostridia bacterium]
MSKIKKIIAAILVFAVCLSVMAAPVSAAQAGSYPNIYTDSPVLTEIGRGGSVTYQFMPAYTGVYRFYSEGENDSFAVLRDSSFNEMVSNDDISDENLNFAVEGTLYVGETYYLECSLSSRKDSGFYYVTVTKLSGTEYIQILGDRQIEGTIGDTVTLEAQMYPDDSFEGYGWYSNNTGVADVDQNGVVTFISSGYAQIVAVTDITGMTDSVTVYVDDCYSIEAGLSVSNIISSNKPSCRYKFIPNESGKYPVSFQSLNGEMININILNKDTDECIYSNSSSDSAENIEFKAGCSYIIDIYNYEAQSDIEFVLSLSTLIYLNGISIIDYDGNDIDNYSEYIGKTYSFNIKFDPEDIREDISWKSSDDSIASVDEYGNVTLNSPGYAIITATAKSGVEDTVLVNVKDYVNVVCNAGYNEFLCKNGDRFIFRFTPNEDGYYNIKASNHGGYFMTIRLLESEYGDTLYGDFEKTYHFIAGSEHLIEIKASGEEFQTSNFTFIIEKMNTAT